MARQAIMLTSTKRLLRPVAVAQGDGKVWTGSGIRGCPTATVPSAWAYAYNDVLNYKSQAAIPRPAETILQGDTGQVPEWGWFCSSTFWNWWTPEVWQDRNGNIPPSNYWDDSQVDPLSVLLHKLPDGTDLDTDAPNPIRIWSAVGRVGNIRYRHNEGANLSFADGHAKWFKKGGTVKLYHFRFNLQNRL